VVATGDGEVPRALLFDLFGTVVHFAARVPIAEVAGTRWVATMDWLRPIMADRLPAVPFEALVGALGDVTRRIVEERPPEYREVPSRERFYRALQLLGLEGDEIRYTAQELSRVHMHHLASTTYLPNGYGELLRSLGGEFRLALVSNFDHGPTARDVLQKHGIADKFSAILISDEVGRRKPHPAIFTAACEAVGVMPSEAWFIGDNEFEDIAGAAAAGIPSVWVDAKRPPEATPSNSAVRDLFELARVVLPSSVE